MPLMATSNKFLCIAKGGGSANKTYLYQETKALLTPGKLKNYRLRRCARWHGLSSVIIAFVIGGTAETNLKTVKLASAKYYDELPTEGMSTVRRSAMWNWKRIADRSAKSWSGAQFGKYFAHDIRVIRLPRHGASCPVGMGVSCLC